MDRRHFVETMLLARSARLLSSAQWRSSGRHAAAAGPEIFDVRRFGALGDDRADDSRAFAAALSAAAVRGGTVIVPPATYRTSAMLRVPSGVDIRGEGLRSIVHRADGDSVVFAIIEAHNVEISDLTIVGRFSHALAVDHSSAVRLFRCQARGATIRRFGYSSGALIVASRSVTIEECTFANNGGDAPGQSSDIQCEGLGQRSRELRIINNQCLSSGASMNILCYDTSESEIRGNIVRGARIRVTQNHGYGILIYSTAGNPEPCVGNVVIGNHVSHTDGSGIYLARCERSRVEDNIIDDVARVQDDQTLPVAGIALNQNRDTRVLRNRITGSGRKGISIASSVPGMGRIEVRDNTIEGVAGYGIHLRGVLTGIQVTGNTLSNVAGGIGADTPEPQDDIEIIGNVLTNVIVGPAISLRSASRSAVNQNQIRNCSGFALDLVFRDHASTVDGNVIEDAGRAADPKRATVRIARPPGR